MRYCEHECFSLRSISRTVIILKKGFLGYSLIYVSYICYIYSISQLSQLEYTEFFCCRQWNANETSVWTVKLLPTYLLYIAMISRLSIFLILTTVQCKLY